MNSNNIDGGTKTSVAMESVKRPIGNYNFGGYVTKYDILCSDGRTIMPGAFKNCCGTVVPLTVSPPFTTDTTVGYVFLENCDDGVYGYGMFYDSPLGRWYKQSIEDESIKGLGIYADQLIENDKCVMYGVIRAVMPCIYPANPYAKIDTINKKEERMTDKEIVISAHEIEAIIAEKYDVNPQNGDSIALVVENKTVNYPSENAKKVYYPVAYIWKKGEVKNNGNT